METAKKGFGKKATTEERQQRFEYMEALLTKLYTSKQAVRLFKKKFNLGTRTAERYIKLVQATWRSESEPTREERRAEIERATDDLYRISLKDSELSAALGALNLKAKLNGLATRIEHTGKDGEAIKVEVPSVKIYVPVRNPE